ncbi:hypothetical protein DCAR_0417180 [Daucus carota subsp. sativus]|uniref:Protein kinase domain-containing protein n=1 Tax=Daucus carota subsp. sativus TaxID=79200 RepID=A0A165Y5L3_DAUCS|nr:PREDICTED: serine/threonine-protein kinase max-2-like [Daucus carota subsp. sativus]WOG97839.1 hypothetical protein DCAR_0417180 [Daucus carota subsp. sativus]
MSGRRRRPPINWPFPTSRSPRPSTSARSSQSSQAGSPPQSLERTMKELLEKARAKNPQAPPSAPPPTTFQDLIAPRNRTTQIEYTLRTNPVNGHMYKVHDIIGSSTSGRATVYRGVYCVTDTNELERMEHYDLYIAVKVTDMEDQDEYGNLVDRMYRCREVNHPFLLQMREEFVLENMHYFVFLMMEGSLRCLWKSFYTNGIPEKFIAIALRTVLEVLAVLHEEGHLHQELNAGHIYYKMAIPAIKIGFLPSIYRHNSGDEGQALPGNNLPLSTICEWGAAPEIYHLRGEYTEKCDVWLVGITALELVYGGIEVEDREGLERLIAKAKSGKGIAKERVKAAGRYLKKLVMKKLKIGESGSDSKKRKVILSRAFRGMLKSCLAEDARERSTADELRQHDFFRNIDCLQDIYAFRDAVWALRAARDAREARERSAVPSASNVADPSGSNVAGPSTRRNVAASSTGSNVAGPSTRSNVVAAPSSGRSVAASSTGSNVAGPSTRSSVAASSTGSNVAGPSTRSNVAGPSTEGNVAAPSTGSNVAGPSTGGNVAAPSTGSNVAGPSTGKNETKEAKP